MATAGPLTPEEEARYTDLDSRSLHNFTNVDLADYLRLRNKLLADNPERPSVADDIGHFAHKSLGQPFRLNAVRFDLSESDCVVFTERCIAMACASDWESYYRMSERLRHKDGAVAYKNRNFFTLGDWVPNNAWLLRDVTGELGPSEDRPAQSFTHVVRPKVFIDTPAAPGSQYVRTVFKGSDYQSPNKETRTELYIPRDRVPDVLDDLKTGDIALVLRQAAGGHLGCDHIIEIVRETDGQIVAMFGSPPHARPQTLTDFLRRYDFVVGFKFLRIRDDARQIVSAELERLGTLINVPEPSAEDAKVETLRARRAGSP